MTRLLFALAVLLALATAAHRADACCLGCPCTKYQQHEQIVEIAATGYTHSASGAVPAWSLANIKHLLTTGYWAPFPAKLAVAAPQTAPRKGDPMIVERPPSELHFVNATMVTGISKTRGRQILIRRIERHGSAILVEVDDRTWKLATCPKKPGYACLVDPGKLALDPIPPVDTTSP